MTEFLNQSASISNRKACLESMRVYVPLVCSLDWMPPGPERGQNAKMPNWHARATLVLSRRIPQTSHNKTVIHSDEQLLLI